MGNCCSRNVSAVRLMRSSLLTCKRKTRVSPWKVHSVRVTQQDGNLHCVFAFVAAFTPGGASRANSTTPSLASLVLSCCITHPFVSHNQIKAEGWKDLCVHSHFVVHFDNQIKTSVLLADIISRTLTFLDYLFVYLSCFDRFLVFPQIIPDLPPLPETEQHLWPFPLHLSTYPSPPDQVSPYSNNSLWHKVLTFINTLWYFQLYCSLLFAFHKIHIFEVIKYSFFNHFHIYCFSKFFLCMKQFCEFLFLLDTLLNFNSFISDWSKSKKCL